MYTRTPAHVDWSGHAEATLMGRQEAGRLTDRKTDKADTSKAQPPVYLPTHPHEYCPTARHSPAGKHTTHDEHIKHVNPILTLTLPCCSNAFSSFSSVRFLARSPTKRLHSSGVPGSSLRLFVDACESSSQSPLRHKRSVVCEISRGGGVRARREKRFILRYTAGVRAWSGWAGQLSRNTSHGSAWQRSGRALVGRGCILAEMFMLDSSDTTHPNPCNGSRVESTTPIYPVFDEEAASSRVRRFGGNGGGPDSAEVVQRLGLGAASS